MTTGHHQGTQQQETAMRQPPPPPPPLLPHLPPHPTTAIGTGTRQPGYQGWPMNAMSQDNNEGDDSDKEQRWGPGITGTTLTCSGQCTKGEAPTTATYAGWWAPGQHTTRLPLPYMSHWEGFFLYVLFPPHCPCSMW
jgi:hypothetical protein